MLNKKELGVLCVAYAALVAKTKLASDQIFELENLIKKQLVARRPLTKDFKEFPEIKNLLEEGHRRILNASPQATLYLL